MSHASLPIHYECLGCFYDLGGSESPICPECGRVAGGADLAVFSARENARTQIVGFVLLELAIGGAICALFAAGVGVLTRNLDGAAGALGVCGAAVCGSIVAGAIASLFARRRERAAYFIVWMRTHVWLNASWLCAPMSGLIVVAALFGGRNSYTHLMVALIGLVVWLVATLLCLLRWAVVFNRGVRRLHLRGRAVRIAFALAALVVLLGSMGLGVAAGETCLRVAGQMAEHRP